MFHTATQNVTHVSIVDAQSLNVAVGVCCLLLVNKYSCTMLSPESYVVRIVS